MYSETAPALCDVDESVHKIRQLVAQRGELVDNNEQSRKRPRGASSARIALAVGHFGTAQQPFSMSELRLEAANGASAERGVEIRHESHDMREPGACVERAAALVVDEDERQLIRAALDRKAEHETAEQFGLPGAGGPTDEAVRPVAAEVEA